MAGADLTLAEVLHHLQTAEEALGRKVNPTCYTMRELIDDVEKLVIN